MQAERERERDRQSQHIPLCDMHSKERGTAQSSEQSSSSDTYIYTTTARKRGTAPSSEHMTVLPKLWKVGTMEATGAEGAGAGVTNGWVLECPSGRRRRKRW